MNLSRRTFIISAALAPVACGVPLSYEQGTPVTQPNPLPVVRPPQVGQEWIYVKKDVFNGKILGIITERVANIGSSITIDRSQDGNRLPGEIHSSWGFVTTDPQWPQLMAFNPPLPLWPLELSSSWSKQFDTKYSIVGYPDGRMSWQEYMSVHGWERITGPAGTFIALRFQSLINFENSDPNIVNCIRKETIWFVPQIGRWVARESTGSYQVQGQFGAVLREDSFQWQLTSYK
jgi:hypothetical protein